MKNTISPRDYEVLSAYLDGQLDPTQRANLEARLKTNPVLAETLRSLSQTRSMLRSLPMLKAPRSFKLTPEMAGLRPVPRFYPFFQLASVLASLLLVVVLAGDFLGLSLGARTAATAPASAPLQAVQPTQVAGVQSFSAKSSSNAGTLVGTPSALATQQDQVAASPALGTGAAAPTAYPPRAAILAATQAPELASTESAEASQIPPELSSAPFNPEVTPTASATEQVLPTPTPTMVGQVQAPVPVETQRPPNSLPPIRIGEIVLALVAAGTGLTAYLLRRGMGR